MPNFTDFLKPNSNAFIWFTHRLHRDWLLAQAVQHNQAGWLNPPFAFFSELPNRFAIKTKPISLLDRRALIHTLATQYAREHQIRLPESAGGVTRTNPLDSFFAELLPEGIKPEQLRRALTHAQNDDFAHRRNNWIVDTYTAYLNTLAQRDLYDARSIHALIAERLEAGELKKAINNADELHIFGLYSTRARARLLSALAQQQDVKVTIYTTSTAEQEFKDIIEVTQIERNAEQPTIQPAPDAWREAEWIASEAKKLIVNKNIDPHDIAIVARTGLEDTRRTLQVFRSAGIPATARVRTPFTQISAIKALLVLFRAAAENWSYPNLRRVLTNPYFKLGVDVRSIDRVAQEARPSSLQSWEDFLARILQREQDDLNTCPDEHKPAHEIRIKRYRGALEQLTIIRPGLEQLCGQRTTHEWIELSREIIDDGWFDFRKRICRPPMARNDVVRLDQRGIRQLETLLRQWSDVADDTESLTPAAWYAQLRTLLAGQELVLTTPGQKGVQILEAHDAALAPFRATFVMHANDGVFPRLPASGGLFADEERVALRGAGLPVETYESALQRERALWSAVTGGDRVVITYRTTDPSGTPLLPSLLVPEHDETTELPRAADLVGEPLNAAQERYQAARQVMANEFATPHPDALRHAIVQAHAEQLRGAPQRTTALRPINPWNGQLRDPLLLQHLAAKFGAEHCWSASQLEQYGKNPFFYLVERVLKLEEVEEADEETNLLTTGGVAHEVLELFYNQLKDRLPVDVSTATQIFGDAARTTFAAREASGEWLGLQALWEQRKRWICETLVRFIEWDFNKHIAKGEQPSYLEYNITEDTELNGEDTEGRSTSMRLRGFVDRIDRLRRGGYKVIDYKTNSVPSGKSGFCDGSVLQGVIYVEALRQLGIGATCSVYRSIKQLKNGAEIKTSQDEYAEGLRVAFSIPARVRAGLFEVNMAASADWAPWHPDLGITRSQAQLAKGETRFG